MLQESEIAIKLINREGRNEAVLAAFQRESMILEVRKSPKAEEFPHLEGCTIITQLGLRGSAVHGRAREFNHVDRACDWRRLEEPAVV